MNNYRVYRDHSYNSFIDADFFSVDSEGLHFYVKHLDGPTEQVAAFPYGHWQGVEKMENFDDEEN